MTQLTLHQLAAAVGMSHSHLRSLANKGLLTTTRLGNQHIVADVEVAKQELATRETKRGPKPKGTK